MVLTYPKGYKLQLSTNFNLQELHCHCASPACRLTAVAEELVRGLQLLRDIAGPIDINSGFRCLEYNRFIGGELNSYHTVGMAADLVPRFIKPAELKEFTLRVPAFNNGGIGLADTFLHVDVRPTMARWTYPIHSP